MNIFQALLHSKLGEQHVLRHRPLLQFFVFISYPGSGAAGLRFFCRYGKIFSHLLKFCTITIIICIYLKKEQKASCHSFIGCDKVIISFQTP